MTTPLPPSFVAWLAELGVHARLQPLLHTIGVWGQDCLPDDVAEADRTIAYMDLAVAFFHLDDLQGDAAARAYDDVDGLLADPARAAPDAPVLAAYHALIQRVAARGAGLGDYLAGRRRLVRAYRRRAELVAGRATCSFAQYLELRMTTIFVAPWLHLWELLEGRLVGADDPRRATLEAARGALTRWHALANDLVSVARDARAGTPNLVPMLAAERGLSIEAATATVTDLLAAAERDLAAACAALRDDPRPAIARFLEFVDICHRGAVTHYAARRNPARYAALSS